MRSKRRKPERDGFGRRRYEGQFGRQIDADLPQDGEEETAQDNSQLIASSNRGDNIDFANHEFEGADLPELDEPGAQAVTEAPVITQATVRERAVRLLVNREHGRKELEQKLLQRDLPADLITTVLDQLAQEGLQCDTRFAESYTRMRVDRGYGANKIRADLQTRRLEQSVVEEAISDNGADWTVIAGGALSKKFGRMAAVDSKARAKMQRFLYQRGFAPEEIRSAMASFESSDSNF